MAETGMPIGDGPGDGDGGGCKPGVVLEGLSLNVSPTSDSAGPIFIAVGTHVTLFGQARVRRWFPDCTSNVSEAPIEWELFYQPVGGLQTNVTSILQGGHTSNMSAFDAGLPGVYNVSLLCRAVVAVTGKTIFVGPAFSLDGTAKVWLQNEFVGTRKFENVAIHAVLVV
jgi:hypothetical protein